MQKIKNVMIFFSSIMLSIMMAINVAAMPFNPNDHTSVDMESTPGPIFYESRFNY